MRRAVGWTALTVIVAGAAVATAIAYHPAIERVPPAAAGTYDQASFARGAELAAIGDCAVCHTAPGGPALAGGRAVPTPFGVVHATNITPDVSTGIGSWSLAAFTRAMRDGIARDGSHLYPVLPYPHFTRASDTDIEALYAFLMTRRPETHQAPANGLPFPLDQRVVLAGWNLLFLRPGAWQPDPEQDAEWNRGAYLAEAVGHCGACHTPHNPLGAEQASDRYQGGVAEDWPAPALQIDSRAPRRWTEAALTTYLATGYQEDHGAAAGPMTAVTQQLSHVPIEDVRAIAHYFTALMAMPPHTGVIQVGATPAASTDLAAQSLFEGACGSCHGAAAPMMQAGAPSLALATSVHAQGPEGVANAIVHGLPWHDGRAGAYMPAFGGSLTDAQVAALVTYVRARFSHQGPWDGVAGAVDKARQGKAS